MSNATAMPTNADGHIVPRLDEYSRGAALGTLVRAREIEAEFARGSRQPVAGDPLGTSPTDDDPDMRRWAFRAVVRDLRHMRPMNLRSDLLIQGARWVMEAAGIAEVPEVECEMAHDSDPHPRSAVDRHSAMLAADIRDHAYRYGVRPRIPESRQVDYLRWLARALERDLAAVGGHPVPRTAVTLALRRAGVSAPWLAVIHQAEATRDDEEKSDAVVVACED